MSNWKNTFEKAANKFENKDELELSYKFGAPATNEELEEVEKTLGMEIPDELRQLLSEFNGIEANEKYWGEKQLYLNTDYILNEVPKYFKESGNYVPPKEELDKVIFFAHQNGFAALFALCIKPFNEFKAGVVLVLESDTGEFELECKSLRDFVSSSEYCHLG